jgi:hypothetical protein
LMNPILPISRFIMAIRNQVPFQSAWPPGHRGEGVSRPLASYFNQGQFRSGRNHYPGEYGIMPCFLFHLCHLVKSAWGLVFRQEKRSPFTEFPINFLLELRMLLTTFIFRIEKIW